LTILKGGAFGFFSCALDFLNPLRASYKSTHVKIPTLQKAEGWGPKLQNHRRRPGHLPREILRFTQNDTASVRAALDGCSQTSKPSATSGPPREILRFAQNDTTRGSEPPSAACRAGILPERLFASLRMTRGWAQATVVPQPGRASAD
jgi:hypothetical protein